MTTKHFIELADTLRAFFETIAGKEMDEITKGILVIHILRFCQSQNPKFDQEKWLTYLYR